MELQKQSYLSGIKELQVADAASTTFQDIIQGELDGFSASDVTVIPFTRHTGSFASDISQGGKGIVRDKSASIFFPGISTEVLNKLDELIGQKLVVGVLTREDEFWVLGTPDEPLKLNANYSSGKALDDRSGFEIQFSSEVHIQLIYSPSEFE